MRAKGSLAGSLVVAAIALFLFATHAAADSATTASNEIRAALEKWTRDFNDRNSQSVCSLFAADLISNYQGQPEGSFDSMCARLKRSVGNPDTSYHYDLKINEILVSGNLAAVRLVWTLTIRRKGQSHDLTIVEPGLDVFRRETDGAWKIARYLSYPLDPSSR